MSCKLRRFCPSNVNVNVIVFSHLLSAAYKMTSGPLHASRGILVTCETLLTFSTAYDSSFDRGFAARNKKVLRLFNDASISKMIIATAWVFSQDLGFFEAILGSWFFSEGLGFFLGFS